MTGTAREWRRSCGPSTACRVVPVPTNRPCTGGGCPPRVFDDRGGEVGGRRGPDPGAARPRAARAGGHALRRCLRAPERASWTAGLRAPAPQRPPGQGGGGHRGPGGPAGRGSRSRRTWQAAAPTSSSGPASRSWADFTSSRPSCTTRGRIDRQLFGRCGRQGDPGSFEIMASLEDEILSLSSRTVSGRLAKLTNPRAALGRHAETPSPPGRNGPPSAGISGPGVTC